MLKLVAGIGVAMGMRVVGTVEDGYRYLSPCGSLMWRYDCTNLLSQLDALPDANPENH